MTPFFVLAIKSSISTTHFLVQRVLSKMFRLVLGSEVSVGLEIIACEERILSKFAWNFQRIDCMFRNISVVFHLVDCAVQVLAETFFKSTGNDRQAVFYIA